MKSSKAQQYTRQSDKNCELKGCQNEVTIFRTISSENEKIFYTEERKSNLQNLRKFIYRENFIKITQQFQLFFYF